MKKFVYLKTEILVFIMLYFTLLAVNFRLSEPVFAQQVSSVSTQLSQKNGLQTTTINSDSKASNSKAAAAYDPTRVIVRFKNGTSFLPGSGRVVSLLPRQNVHLVTNPLGLSVKEAISQYKNNPNVVYAEPDYIVNAIFNPNDFDTTKQWDMTKISASTAWDITSTSSGSTLVVAVIDTGIDFNHPDLQANLYGNGFTCMNGSCVPGGQDDHGHGTHVAGTIGAVTNNGIGVVGVAGPTTSIKLLPIKFLSSGGSGSISDAVLGFQQLLSLKTSTTAPINIRVTNNSWGGGGYSQALKDAMLALEATGVLNVCAAGNSSVNADTTPMYPGAYDNRGIVSVLATDSADSGASFTNFGIASVDIGAPGVNIYSTSPTGTCSLCDITGYKFLSGTSMASPHVAGVAAMLLFRNSSLTAVKARDVLLDPNSYDPLSQATAIKTSTGGRLNYWKVLNNTTAINNPSLNNFPTVTVGADAYASAGQQVSFQQTSSDPDNDTLRTSTGRGSISSFSAWMFGWKANQLFPTSVASSFTAPTVARVVAMPYDISVSDNRGGGATARNWAVVSAGSTGLSPTGTLSVQSTGTINTAVPISYTARDPEGGTVAWDLFVTSGSGSSGWCCFTGSSMTWTPNADGIYRITAQGIDNELNATNISDVTTNKSTAIIKIGNPTNTNIPPISFTNVSQKSGVAPLTISVDALGSSDPDGTLQRYAFDCGVGYAVSQTSNQGSCTFTQPGAYWVRAFVYDNSGAMGVSAEYVVVTPSSGSTPPDTTPPTVSIASPTSGTTVSGTVTLTANASDNIGVKDVTFYLDPSTTNSSLGLATYDTNSQTYSVQWNTTGLASGSHTLIAIAQDAAGNKTTSTSVTVNAPSSTADFSLATAKLTSPIALKKGSAKGTSVTLNLTGISVGSSVTLSVPTKPTGVSASFSTNPVNTSTSAASSTTLTLKANKNAPTIPSTSPVDIIVSGTNGSNTHTLSIPITIN